MRLWDLTPLSTSPEDCAAQLPIRYSQIRCSPRSGCQVLQSRAAIIRGFAAHVMEPATARTETCYWKNQDVARDNFRASWTAFGRKVGQRLPGEFGFNALCVFYERVGQNWWASDV